MKYFYKVIFILFTLTFISSQNAFCQKQWILPLPPNLESTLIHTYTVVGPKAYTFHARKLKNTSYELAKFESLSIDAVNGMEDLPDLVFVINDSTTEALNLIKAAHEIDAVVINLAPNDMMEPGKTAADIGLDKEDKKDKESYHEQMQFIAYVLRFIYYSGERPQDYVVFNPKADRYGAFRSPTVIRTFDETLIAVTEGQRDISNDFSPTDIVYKTSTDHGVTWSGLKAIVKSEQGEILINPTLISTKDKSRIVMIYSTLPARDRSGVLKSGQINQTKTYSCFSEDNGKTWSKSQDITMQVKPPSVSSYRVGSGLGIFVSSGANTGRLMVPCWTFSPGNWYNYLVYSDDNGSNWKIASGHSAYGAGESQMVQISDTAFLVNAVSRRSLYDKNFDIPKGWNPQNFDRTTRHRIQFTVSINDSIAKWSEPDMQTTLSDAICQGSMIRYSEFGNRSDSIILICNAASRHSWPAKNEPYMLSPPMRVNGTIRISFDNGSNWENFNRIYGNRFTAFQNSGMVRLDDDRIGCIFDTNQGIKFTVFDLDWLKGVTPRERKYKEFHTTALY